MEDIMQFPVEEQPSPTGHLPAEASELITALSHRNLRPDDITRIRLLIPTKRLDIHDEIQTQNDIINAMKSRILDENNILMAEAGPKDVSALIGSFNSFLNLYLRSMDKLDKDKQMQEIEFAIVEAIEDMPKEIQDTFFSHLKKRLEV